MGVGDVLIATASVAPGASGTFQPAAGVEVVITAIGLTRDSDWSFGHTNGTVNVRGPSPNANTVHNAILRLFLNNTVYLHAFNNNVATKEWTYSGVQTK